MQYPDNLFSLQGQLAAATDMGPFTVATLPIPDATTLGRRAIVTDLFGGNRYGKVVCEREGAGFYFWRPTGADSFQQMATTADTLISPLANASSILFTGVVPALTTRTFTLSTAGGWPGCTKEMRGPAGLLGTLNIAGTGLGSAVSLALGGYQRYVLDYTGGTLAWSRLL